MRTGKRRFKNTLARSASLTNYGRVEWAFAGILIRGRIRCSGMRGQGSTRTLPFYFDGKYTFKPEPANMFTISVSSNLAGIVILRNCPIR